MTSNKDFCLSLNVSEQWEYEKGLLSLRRLSLIFSLIFFFYEVVNLVP